MLISDLAWTHGWQGCAARNRGDSGAATACCTGIADRAADMTHQMADRSAVRDCYWSDALGAVDSNMMGVRSAVFANVHGAAADDRATTCASA